MPQRTLFTIGHSTHDLPDFLALLTKHAVTAIADVRSQPSSRLQHFNQTELAESLRGVAMEYVFLGRELGARRTEPRCYEDGFADYDRIAREPVFQSGIARLRAGSETQRICLLCAEKEPLDCHRAVLVCRHLRRPEICIQHILADGTVEDHSQTEQRLVRITGVEPTLFEPDLTQADLLNRAYELRGREIAYRLPTGEVP